MVQGRDILVGGLEREMLRMADWNEDSPMAKDRLALSVRLAILFSDAHAIIPASGYFETTCGYEVVLGFRSCQERGQLVLQGSSGGPSQYIAYKLDQWRGSRQEQKLYGQAATRRIDALERSAWRSKAAPTDDLIIVNWNEALEGGTHPLLDVYERAGMSNRRAEKRVAGLPEKLEGTVLLADNVERHIRDPRVSLDPQDHHQLRVHLARGFFGSHLNDANAVALVDPFVGFQEMVCPPGTGRVKAGALARQLQGIGQRQLLLAELACEDFAAIAESAPWLSLRPKLLARAESGTSLSAEEQQAVAKAAQLSAGSSVAAVEDVLAQQNEALEMVERRRQGHPQPGTSSDRLARMSRAMSTNPFWIGSSDLPLNGPPPAIDLDRLSEMLFQVLDSSSPSRARELIETFDHALQEFEELRPEVVAELIQEREALKDKLRTLPSSFRRSLVQVCTTAAGSSLAKGIELVLRAMVG